MNRRAVMVAAAAVALLLAPAAAVAQAVSPQASALRTLAGPGFAVVGSSPAAGVPFTVRASGARANESVTLTITRHPASNGSHPRSLTKSANARGVVEFVVAIAEDGTYELVSSAGGSTLSRQSVTVVDHGTVIVAGEGAAADSAGSAPAAAPRVGGRLASTGFPGLGLAGGGGVLVLAGAGLVAVARRRQLAQAPA
jgi:hypothetical protein